jgi:catecholate siderophore receptor
MGECNFVRSRLLAAAIVGILSTAAATANAADAPATKEMSKISVGATEEGYKTEVASSPKYTQALRDTPQTITVIPSAVIKEQGATNLRDVLRNSPGITFQAGEGGAVPGDQNFSMRGFSSRNSLFVDGVRDIGAYTRDSFNLQQVEVVKGPTGAVAGRSTTAGAINQVSKTPHAGDSQDYSLGYGTDDYKRVTGDLNIGLNDSMALRLNAMYHDAEVANRDVVENKRWGFAPSFALGLGADTRFTLGYLYVEEDNVPDYGLPWGGNNPVTQTTSTNPAHNGTFPTGAYHANPRVDQSNFYGLKNYDFEDIETQVANAQIEHDFSNSLHVRNVLRYVESDRNSAITSPRPPNRQLQRRTIGTENLTNLTDFTVAFATGAVGHTLVAGLELSREDTSNQNSSQTNNQPTIQDFFSPDPNQRPFGPMPVNSGNPSKTRTDNIAIYALDTIAVTEQWAVTAGVRRDDADVDYQQRNFATGGVITDLSKSEAEVTWNAAVTFKPVENGTLYLAYGTGFDPTVDAGGAGPGLGTLPTDANNINLDPEESSNLEAGTKWDLFDERLSLNAAIFRMEKKNVRTRTANADPIVLRGEQRVDGIEVGASGMITDAWSVFAGAVYLDSEYEASLNTIELGQELLLTPDLSASLWTTYALPFGLTVGIGAQYSDDIVRARTATREFVVSSRVLIDAMASYTINKQISLRLNATNLEDKDYVDRFGGGHYIPGPGRTVSLTANFGF